MNKFIEDSLERFDKKFKVEIYDEKVGFVSSGKVVSSKKMRTFLKQELEKAVNYGQNKELKRISSYNVAFCNKCKSLYKTDGHKNCKKEIKKG